MNRDQFMRLNLRQLEVFEAVMETGSISGAAARLHCTQAAVSIALSKFGEGTGLAFFDRSRGGALPAC
jgi:DNA-binding transcriptional LysR family regulator